MTPPPAFCQVLKSLERQKHTIWLGQSVDTSTLHAGYAEFATLPILTSVGCAIRRPQAIGEKFDGRLRTRIGALGRLMVDSGGFVMMTKRDLKWDACRVSQLYSRLDADHLVSLDVPPNGLDSQIDRSYKYDETISNLEQLADRFGNRVVPVIHGTNLDEVEKNCLRTARVCPSPGLVGIGGLVPTLQKSGSIRNAENNIPHKWISDVVRCVRSHFPCSPLHLFGVGSLHTVLAVFALGVQSVDSIGWRQAAGFGSVYIPGRHRRLLTNRRRVRLCRPFASCEDLEILAACICPECRGSEQRGSNIERLAQHFKPRAIHNIWVLYGEVAAYLAAREVCSDAAFLSSRLSDAWQSAIGI